MRVEGAHTHLDDHTLAKHGEAVSNGAALTVVPAQIFDNLTQDKASNGRMYVCTSIPGFNEIKH